MKINSIFKLFSTLTLVAAGGFVVGNSLEHKRAESVDAASTDKWSMIGTPDWSTDTSLTYTSARNFYGSSDGRFELEYEFSAGDEFKFRKDKAWSVDIGYGGQTAQGIDAYLTNSSGNFSVRSNGKYLLTLHENVATYGDRSYGFAIAKAYHVAVYDGPTKLKEYYFEDYDNAGYTLSYSASESEYCSNPAYTLEGLYTDVDLTSKFNSGTNTTNQSLTLYAKFKKSSGRYLTGTFGSCNWGIENASFLTPINSQYEGTITLERGDLLKCAYYNGTGLESYFGYSDTLTTCGAYFCFKADGSDNLECKAGGSYNFYFTDNDFGEGKKISIEINGTARTAEQLAAKIMSFDNTPNTCGSRFPDMKTMYLDNLSESEKSTFLSYASSPITDFKDAYDRYVAWAAALGQKPWELGAVGGMRTLFANDSKTRTLVPIIVIVSIVSMTTVGCLLFIKKRKSI